MRVKALISLMALAVIAIVVTSSPAARPGEARAEQRADDAMHARLVALQPGEPMAYFELAEELAGGRIGGARASESIRLARTLFVLSFELDRRARFPAGLGPSVCIALAELAESPNERAWLLELANIAGGGVLARRMNQARSAADDGTSLWLAQAINFGRRDEGKLAKSILRRPDVAPRVARIAAMLEGARKVLDLAETRPHCPGCGSRRFGKPGMEGASSTDLCSICLGNPGLRLTPDEFLSALRVEASLVGAEHEHWSAQLLMDGGAPMREPDAAELVRTYGGNPRMPYWRPANADSLGSAANWTGSPR